MMMEPFHMNRMFLITQELSMRRQMYSVINEDNECTRLEVYPYNFQRSFQNRGMR